MRGVSRPALPTGAHACPIVLPDAREMSVFHVSKVQEGAVPLAGVYLQELRRSVERTERSLCAASDVGYRGDEAAVE